MPENEQTPGEEKLLILPLGEESKKITQVISNDTARQIIELLADAPLSASDIAERLQMPLTTIVYNLENLEKVGLIKVEKIKYSEKGREVKIYAPVRKLIVVVPEKTDRKSVTDLLRKYLGVILAAVFASSLIEFVMRGAVKNRVIPELSGKSIGPSSSAESLMQNATSAPAMINETAKSGLSGTAIPTATPVPTVVREVVPAAPVATPIYAANATASPTSIPEGAVSKVGTDLFSNIADKIAAHPGLMFLFGCLFAITLLIIWDYLRKRKNG